jgi:hypothetical protein
MNSNGDTPNDLLIPNPLGVGSQNAIPNTPSKVLALEIKNITGFYDNLQGGGFTNVYMYLDSGSTPGTAIQTAVQYDWTGDGTFDRTEMFFACTPNDLVNYELCNKKANPNVGENLFGVTGTQYQNLTNGKVRFSLWGAFDKFHNTTIRSEFNGVDTSFVKIPYITSYVPQGIYKCGVVANPSTAFAPTTGPATTGEPCWDNKCSSYTPVPTTENTNPPPATSRVTGTATTISGTATTISGTNNCNCPANGVCTSYSCVGTQCVENKLSGTTCRVEDFTLNTCFDGLCQNGDCLATSTVISCDAVASASVVSVALFALFALFML